MYKTEEGWEGLYFGVKGLQKSTGEGYVQGCFKKEKNGSVGQSIVECWCMKAVDGRASLKDTRDTGLLVAGSSKIRAEIRHRLGLMEFIGSLGENRFPVTGAISQFSLGLRVHRKGGCRLQREMTLSPSLSARERCARPMGGASVSVVPCVAAAPLAP